MNCFYRTLLSSLVLHVIVHSHVVSAQPPASRNTPSVASPDFAFKFPKDHGSHPDFQTEWWYLTGQLFTGDAEPFHSTARYGFQLTFFRTERDGKQWHLAHAAITDIEQKTFFTESRLAAESLGVADVRGDSLSVHHADWTLKQAVGQTMDLAFTLRDQGKTFTVKLAGDLPPPLLQGKNGYSRKGTCETCASEYYSLPRITLSGEITDDANELSVHGLGWFDHEFMTNTLQSGQTGWDWLSVMLADGRNLMIFQLRNDANGKDFGAWTLQYGKTLMEGSGDDFTLTPTAWWTNPDSGKKYPTAFTIEIPSVGLTLPVRALVDNQLRAAKKSTASPAYWEGAIAGTTVSGAENPGVAIPGAVIPDVVNTGVAAPRSTVSGSGIPAIGYLEMTGYEDPLSKQTL